MFPKPHKINRLNTIFLCYTITLFSCKGNHDNIPKGLYLAKHIPNEETMVIGDGPVAISIEETCFTMLSTKDYHSESGLLFVDTLPLSQLNSGINIGKHTFRLQLDNQGYKLQSNKGNLLIRLQSAETFKANVASLPRSTLRIKNEVYEYFPPNILVNPFNGFVRRILWFKFKHLFFAKTSRINEVVFMQQRGKYLTYNILSPAHFIDTMEFINTSPVNNTILGHWVRSYDSLYPVQPKNPETLHFTLDSMHKVDGLVAKTSKYSATDQLILFFENGVKPDLWYIIRTDKNKLTITNQRHNTLTYIRK